MTLPASTNTAVGAARCCARTRPPARLEEIRDNLLARIAEAESHRWYGEAEGLKVSLTGANAKLVQMAQISASRTKTVELGIPSFADTSARTINDPTTRISSATTEYKRNNQDRLSSEKTSWTLFGW